MGYKLAGYDVIGNLEVDGKINAVYQKNLNPRLSYTMDIRDFVKMDDLPSELFDLDILDGSPPCTVFTELKTDRERHWGKAECYKEGGIVQRLDDLFFWFIRLAEKLKPKVVIAENVPGLLEGSAKTIFYQILDAFYDAGYIPEYFLVNARKCGVPQERERVIFVAQRKDFRKHGVVFDFHENGPKFGEIRAEKGGGRPKEGTLVRYLVDRRQPGDMSLAEVKERLGMKRSMYTVNILYDDLVAPCVCAGNQGSDIRNCDGERCSATDYRRMQTFPEDYDFCGRNRKYILGMSVPPIMMSKIAEEVYKQILI